MSWHGIELLRFDQAPPFLQHNPHIHSGYRAFLSYPACFKSLGVLSNEFMNVWTHLIGLSWATYCIYWVNFVVPSPSSLDGSNDTNSDAADRLLMSLFLFCVQFCMLCSVLFHLLCCASEQDYIKWLRWDLFGIVIGLMGCYFPGIYYAYYCHPWHRDMYLYLVGAMFCGVIILQTHPNWTHNHWHLTRIFTYVFIMAFGVVPVMQWTVINFDNSEEVSLFLYRVVVVYLLAVIAFLFYISLVPEIHFPGKFDIFGHSHQWWHVFVLAAYIWWFETGMALWEYRRANPCKVSP